MTDKTTQPREQASPCTLWRIKFPDGAVAVIDSEPADYMQPYATAYRIAPVAAPEAPTLTQRLNTPDQIDAYARQLAMSLWRTHYRLIAPEFELLDDTYGVLSQIDNMLTGLVLASTGTAPLVPEVAASEKARAKEIAEELGWLQSGNTSATTASTPKGCKNCDGIGACPMCGNEATTASANDRPEAMSYADAAKWARENGLNVPAKWDCATVPGRNAAPLDVMPWEKRLNAVSPAIRLKSADAAKDAEIAELRAALTQQSAAPSRDAILETAVQAVSERAGDSDKISVASAYDAIRACKTNRHALPESCSAQQSAAQAPEGDSFKPVYWWSVLVKCARLLDLPDDEPIPSGVVRAVEKLVAAQASHAGASSEQDAARYRFVKTMPKEMLLAWRGMYGCADEAIDAAMSAATEQKEKP